MRRSALLILGAALAAPLFASAPASANIYCGSFGPVERAFGPLCTVKCAMGLEPQIGPGGRPALVGDYSCFYTD